MVTDDLYRIYLQHPFVKTDTRQLQAGDLFFALKGPNFNGNNFVAEALNAGAAYVLIDEESAAVPGKTILVDDVLKTLQDLALHHRRQFTIPFLAITGSNGKTTTKELIHAVLSTQFRTYTTEGNLNNHIGVPLTLLRIKQDAQMAVVEMGANHQGEIASYCTYTLPTHALITNVGKAHLEGFGGEEGVRKGKGELFDHIRLSGGTAFIMADYEYFTEMSKGLSATVTYGTKDAGVVGNLHASNPFLQVAFTKGFSGVINTQLVGSYNLPNVLAAVAVGKYFCVEEEAIRQALETYQPSNSRSQMVKRGAHQVILDAYNANPSSMKLAIENFAASESKDKILVLGAMAELGADSQEEHQEIIRQIDQHSWKEVMLVGGDFLKIKHPYRSFPSATEAGAWLQAANLSPSYLLVKGSRSMQMEKVLPYLQNP